MLELGTHKLQEGWLYKQSPDLKSWRKLWCVLTENGRLSTFESNTDTKTGATETIKLSNSSTIKAFIGKKTTEFGFEIETKMNGSSSQTFVFYANNRDECQSWMQSISSLIDTLQQMHEYKGKRVFHVEPGKIIPLTNQAEFTTLTLRPLEEYIYSMLKEGSTDEAQYKNLFTDTNVGWQHPSSGETFVHVACTSNNLQILKLLLQYKPDMNIKNSEGETPFLSATRSNSMDIVRFLLDLSSNGKVNIDINAVSNQNSSGLTYAARDGSLELLQLLIDYKFNFTNTINLKMKKWDMNPLMVSLYAKQFEFFKYLYDYCNANKLEMDIYSESSICGNLLHCACRDENVNVIKFVIEELKFLENKDSQALMNKKDDRGYPPILVAVLNTNDNNFDVIKYLFETSVKYKCTIDIGVSTTEKEYDRLSTSFLHLLCQNNYHRCLEWFLNNYTKYIEYNCLDINVIVKTWTPLMKATQKNNWQCVQILCKDRRTKINDHYDENKHNALDIAVQLSAIESFTILIKTLLNRFNISDSTSLIQHSEIINANMIKDWIKLATGREKRDAIYAFEQSVKMLGLSGLGQMIGKYKQEQSMKTSNGKITYFLNQLLNDCFQHSKYVNYPLFVAMLNDVIDNSNDNINAVRQKINEKSKQLFESQCVGKIFAQNLLNCGSSKYSGLVKQKISGAIIQMIKDKQALNDDLMIIGNILSPIEFENALIETVAQCVEIKNSRIQDKLWFKNFIVNSNILGLKSDNANRLIFDIINDKSINNQLTKQQLFIKNKIDILKQDDAITWERLTSFDKQCEGIKSKFITQNETYIPYSDGITNIMNDNGYSVNIDERDLIIDNMSGFNSAFEFENNQYLTQMLIAAHCINDKFQKECKKIFEHFIGVECKFQSAPVKIKDRCQIKVATDYTQRPFPKTSSLLDLVRCSVSFENPIDMINGLNQFIQFIRHSEDKKCITKILRIKNMFKSFNSNINRLSTYTYCDIKLNVLIETHKYKMIGEIQFILSFMLEAKKMGHIFYGYVRNYDLYHQIHEITKSSNVNEIKQLHSKLKSIIVKKNYPALVRFVLFGQLSKLDSDKNQDIVRKLIELCSKNNWEKGLILLKNCISFHENEKQIEHKSGNINDEKKEEFSNQSKLQVSESKEFEETILKWQLLGKEQIGQKLVEYMYENDSNEVKNVIESIADSKKSDLLNYLLNIYHCNEKETQLLSMACSLNMPDIVKILIHFGANVNATSKEGYSPLLYACIANSMEIAEMLLTHDANPNVEDKQSNHNVLFEIVQHRNVQLLKLIVESPSFNFKKFINQCSITGDNLFLVCCKNNSLDCLIYLINTCETKYNHEIMLDIYKTSDSRDMNGLHAACLHGHTDLVRYLLYDLEYLKPKHININTKDKHGRTPFLYACVQGRLDILKMLYEYDPINLDINSTDDEDNSAPILILTQINKYDCVEWLINNTNQQCNVNIQQTTNGITPLMEAVKYGFVKIVSLLCCYKHTQIENLYDYKYKCNALTISVVAGKVECFKIIVNELFDRHNVNDWLSMKNSNILDDNSLNTWNEISLLANMSHFLTQLNTVLYVYEDYDLLRALLHCQDESNIVSDKVNHRSEVIEQIQHIANTFINKYLAPITNDEKEEKDDEKTTTQIQECLTQAILSMINNKQVVNDTILMIGYILAPKKFENALIKTVDQCLSNKNPRDIVWFKQFILNSNILSLKSTIAKDKIIFDDINDKCVNNKLIKQKQFIQCEIKKLTENDFANWQQVIKYESRNVSNVNILRQNHVRPKTAPPYTNLMENSGIVIDERKEELINYFTSEFNGTNEYDNNVYLIQLLMAAYEINSDFQSECQELLSAKSLGINSCYFQSGSIKTKERCQIKSSLEYSDRPWPYNSNILDILRCSVVFSTPKDLMDGLNKFILLVKYNSSKKFRCIKHILRIKNMFQSISNWNINNNDIDNIDWNINYCDIKLNVLIETYKYKMIGEIQFILNFMLKAKQMGHIFYGYVRNYDLYHQIHEITKSSNVNEIKQLHSKLKSIIVKKNYPALVRFVLFGQLAKLNDDKNRDIVRKLIELCSKNNWEKGLILLKNCISFHENEKQIEHNSGNISDEKKEEFSNESKLHVQVSESNEFQENMLNLENVGKGQIGRRLVEYTHDNDSIDDLKNSLKVIIATKNYPQLLDLVTFGKLDKILSSQHQTEEFLTEILQKCRKNGWVKVGNLLNQALSVQGDT